MNDKQRSRILRNDKRKLKNKRRRLGDLNRQLESAVTPASQASFKGKITRCKLDIAILEARINRLS